MIVVTVGTHEQPFDRLLRAITALDGDEPLLVQYGASTARHGRGEWVDYMSFDELADRARAARAFVCHAGVGSIVLARRCGHRPIIMPRRAHLGEHVDEHQMALARRLAAAGLATLVEDERSLAAAVAAAPRVAPAAPGGGPRSGPAALSADVRSRLEALGAARISARAAQA
jgi:exopolysaccharide biosynthesis glucuronosyltransferase PssE